MNRSLRNSMAAAAAVVAIGGLAGMKSYQAAKPAAANAHMVADLSDKILYLYEGNSDPQMYDIADGKDGYPTPKGAFNIRKLTWNPSWTPPDADWARKKSATGP